MSDEQREFPRLNWCGPIEARLPCSSFHLSAKFPRLNWCGPIEALRLLVQTDKDGEVITFGLTFQSSGYFERKKEGTLSIKEGAL